MRIWWSYAKLSIMGRDRESGDALAGKMAHGRAGVNNTTTVERDPNKKKQAVGESSHGWGSQLDRRSEGLARACLGNVFRSKLVEVRPAGPPFFMADTASSH